MKKTQSNLILLYMIFGTSLVIANVIAAKLLYLGFDLFGQPVILTVGAIVYPITFLITDVIGQKWGKKEATAVVKMGFIVQILATILIVIARVLPTIDQSVQSAYVTILGQNWVFVVASLTAYLVSQRLDVEVFHRIKKVIVKDDSDNKKRWIWNNVSTGISQFIDSTIFVVIAFGLGFGWIWSGMINAMIIMILAQYFVKLLLALLDTPVFYLLTRE